MTPALRRRARRVPRWYAVAVLALVLVAGARGAFWVAVSTIWQTDEGQHYGYVHDLATGRGIPVIGEDRVPAQVLALSELNPVDGISATDVTPSPLDRRWGAGREQYEGGQGPVYYALLAPAYRLAADLGPLERLYVLRALTLLLTLATVPLTALLAGALLPDRRVVRLLAPAVLVAWQGVNASGATVNNDALVLPLATAALLGVAVALRDGPGVPGGFLTGLALGLATVTKANAVVIAGPALALAVWVLVRHRRRPLRAARWAAAGAAGAVAPVALWLRWQTEVYGSTQGAVERFNAVLGSTLGPARPTDLDTLVTHWRFATAGLFGQEFLGPVGYSALGLALVTAVGLVGLAVAARRARRREVGVLLVCAAALPVGFLTMAAVVQYALGGVGSVAGRYLHVTFPLLAVLVAGGAVAAFGRRAGTAVVALVVAVTLQAEVALTDRYVSGMYQRGLPVAGVAPSVLQERADRYGVLPPVVVDPPCPAALVALAFPGPPPAAVSVAAGTGDPVAASRVAIEDRGPIAWGYYDTGGRARPFTLRAPADRLASLADADRDPALALEGEDGDPVARVYCAVQDADDVRFAQLFSPQHPDLSHDAVRGWPRGWANAGWMGAALTAAGAIVASVLVRTGRAGAHDARAEGPRVTRRARPRDDGQGPPEREPLATRTPQREAVHGR